MSEKRASFFCLYTDYSPAAGSKPRSQKTIYPPSITKVSPVWYFEASDAR